MYCPNCGKAEQTPNSYCRSCGEFLNDSKKLSALSFGGSSPQQNVNAINVLSLIASIVSLLTGIWMYLTNFSEPFVLYLAAAILLCNAGWHLSNFVVGMKLKKRLSRARRKLSEDAETAAAERNFSARETAELLPEANFENVVVKSVTENTTRQLDKIPRRK